MLYAGGGDASPHPPPVSAPDDTYIIIPSVSVDSRLEELAHVEAWSQTNNLTLNRAKSLEIVFTDKRRKRTFQQPPTLPCICRADKDSWSHHIQHAVHA